MEGIERIHELIEQLNEETKKLFTKATDFSVSIKTDGYRTFSIYATERDQNIPIGSWKHRVLWEQTMFSGKWGNDESEIMNKYYSEHKQLLEV